MAVSLSTYGGVLRSAGYPGQVADQSPVAIDDFINGGAAAIDFGIVVARGATDATCKVPSADGDKLLGLSVRHVTKAADSAGNVKYNQYEAVPVCREGEMFVLAAENATRGDVAISITAGGGTIGSTTGGAAGAGRIALDGSNDKPKVIWETTTTAGNVGKVRVN